MYRIKEPGVISIAVYDQDGHLVGSRGPVESLNGGIFRNLFDYGCRFEESTLPSITIETDRSRYMMNFAENMLIVVRKSKA